MYKFLAWVFVLTLPLAAGATGGWEAACSPDGRQIAFTSSSPHGIPNIWIMDADGSNQRQLTTFGGRGPQWIPDTRKIAFVTLRNGNPAQFVVDPDTQTVADGPVPSLPANVQGLVWSPDGTEVAYTVPSASGKARDLWVASSDGSNARGLTTNFWARQYAWTPDGKQLAVVIGRAIGSSLWIVDPKTKGIKLLYQGFCSSPAYSPDGKYLAFAIPARKEGHRIIRIETATGKRRLIPVRSFDGKSLRWSPDGKRILFASETKMDSIVWTASAEGRDLVQVTPVTMQAFDPSFSPDGKRILFSATREDSQAVDLYVCNSDASVPFGAVKGVADKVDPASLPKYARLTTGQPSEFNPVWSPDGKVLAVATMDRASAKILLVDQRGRKKELVDFDPGSPMDLSWSPDGKLIAFSQGAALQILPSRGGKPLVKLRLRGETTLSWSPDSTLLYFTEWKDGKAGVSSFNLKATETTQLTKGGERIVEAPTREDSAPLAPAEPHSGLGVAGPVPIEKKPESVTVPINDLYPACSPDGKSVAFVRENQVWVMNSDGKDERQVTEMSPPESGQFAAYDPSWSPDGKTILYQVGKFADGKLRWEIWTTSVESKESRLVASESSPSEYVYYLRNISTAAPAFTTDGTAIVFTSVASGVSTVARVAVTGGQVEPLADAPSSGCSLTAGGKLAYVSLANGEERVMVRDLTNGKDWPVGIFHKREKGRK